jgi:hypothetical protein
MKVLWCWRCAGPMPMLDDDEFELVMAAQREGPSVVERERVRRGLPSQLPSRSPHARSPQLVAMLDMYRLLTGFDETVPGAVAHHRISLYGPPCPGCKKPLRTANAKYCVDCGYGMDTARSDPRPLAVREPKSFRDSLE